MDVYWNQRLEQPPPFLLPKRPPGPAPLAPPPSPAVRRKPTEQQLVKFFDLASVDVLQQLPMVPRFPWNTT